MLETPPDVLPWFPYDVDHWEEMTLTLTLEQEGALTRLLRAAWRDAVPCTLMDSPVYLERLLGARWKRFRPLIDLHFSPDPDLPGRIRCQWLTVLYIDQAHRYRKRVERNERHRERLREKLRRLAADEGETSPPVVSRTVHETPPETPPKTLPETQRETSHETLSVPVETSHPLRAESLELRGASPVLKDGQEAPAPVRAPAPEGARAASAEVAIHPSHKERAYFARLHELVELFRDQHPERYEECIAKVRRQLALPIGKAVPKWYQQQFDDEVILAVRALHPKWPKSADEWRPDAGEFDEGAAA